MGLIVRPEGAIVDPAAATGLAAGFLGAVSVVAIWRMGAGEPAARIVFFYTAGATAISGVPIALRWQWPDSGPVWAAFAPCGVLSALAHLLLARGCTIAPADRTNALSYAAVVFAALVGWAAWGDRPGAELLAGTLLIAVAATLVTRRQKARQG